MGQCCNALPTLRMTVLASRRHFYSNIVIPTALPSERQVGFFWGTLVLLFFAIVALLGLTPPSAQALTFNLTFDASTDSAPAGFFTAFNNAIQFYRDELYRSDHHQPASGLGRGRRPDR